MQFAGVPHLTKGAAWALLHAPQLTVRPTSAHHRCHSSSLEFSSPQRSHKGAQHRHQQTAAAQPADAVPPDRPRLPNLCRSIHQGFFELCIQNDGQPAAAALAQIVASALTAYQSGYALDHLRLELEHGVHGAVDAAGYRLTAGEQRFRAQWLDTVYMTMQLLAGLREGPAALEAAQPLRPWRPEDEALLSTVEHMLQGYLHGDPRTAVQMDRSLATSGASGGVASQMQVIAAEFVPVSQVVLLTLKTHEEQQPSLI